MELPQVGDQFESAYQLRDVLGQGGFAVVFRAVELGMAERDVAIKILKPGPRGRYESDIEPRFEREVQMLSQLRDPHTVTLYRYGRTDAGLLYLVFEHVPGRDLDQLLSEVGRLGPDDVIHVMRQVLLALRTAHNAGLLHRDIKPSNIRVFEYMGDPLRVKLLDFGIAKPTFGGEQAQITKTGEMLGTPRYMSPEQLTEKPLEPASDIYSLGIVAFEMLAGGVAHGPGWSDQLDRLHTGHVFSIPELERIGPGLNAIIEKMSAREESDRYRSADDVLRALDELEGAATLPETPAPAAPAVEASRPSRMATTIPEVVYKEERAPADGGQLGLAFFIAAVSFMGFAVLALTLAPGEKSAPDAANTNNDAPVGLVKSAESTTPSAPAPSTTAPADASTPATTDRASPGCSKPAPFTGTGKLRTDDVLAPVRWTVHIPEGYDPERPHPVMLLYHQDLKDGADIIEQTGFDEVADEFQFVIIAPHDPGMGGVMTWFEAGSEAVTHERLPQTAQQLCLDPARIFAVGHGVGGYPVERLSCEPWLAGAATNSFRRETKPLCLNPRPLPFLHLAPMQSDRIPVEGGKGCHGVVAKPALADFEQMWVERNNCAAEQSEWVRHGEHVCLEWRECAARLVSCHLQGGHSWPGSRIPEHSLGGGQKCADHGEFVDFPAAQTIWKFFDSLEPRDDEATAPW